MAERQGPPTRGRTILLGCGLIAAIPVLLCGIFLGRALFSSGSVERNPDAARGVIAAPELMTGAQTSCAISPAAFAEGRVHVSVAKLWLSPAQGTRGLEDMHDATAHFDVRVSGEATATVPRFELRARAKLQHIPATPPDRRYVVPVPASDGWIPSEFVVDSCVEKPVPEGRLGIFWEVLWGS